MTNARATTNEELLKQLPALVAAKDLPKIESVIHAALKNVDGVAENLYALSISSVNYLTEALRDAIIAKDFAITQFLVDVAKVSMGSRVVGEGTHGVYYPMIYFAIKTRELRFVELAVENGAIVKQGNHWDESCWITELPIITAVQELHLAPIVQYLLSKGANPDLPTGAGTFQRNMLIGYAAGNDDVATVEVLASSLTREQLENTFVLVKERCLYALGRCGEKAFPALQAECQRMIKNLLDVAVGCDLSSHYYESRHGFNFLEHLNAAYLNFNGITIDGRCVTHERLAEEKVLGAAQAIVTRADVDAMTDTARRDRLKQRLEQQIKAKGLIIQNDIYNFVPLSVATKVGDAEAVRVRLAAGGDPNETMIYYGSKTPAIVIAAAEGHEAIIDMLGASSKLNFNHIPEAIAVANKNKHVGLIPKLNKLIPVRLAAERGDLDALNARFDAGCDPNELHNNKAPIMYAAENGHAHIVKAIGEHGKYNFKSNEAALKAAERRFTSEVMRALLDVKPINSVDKEGNAKLHYAAKSGNVNEMKALVRRGADVDLPGYGGCTALHIAAAHSYCKDEGEPSPNHIEIIKFLLSDEVKANANLLTRYSEKSALQLAADAGSAKAVALLLPVTTNKPFDELILAPSGSSEWLDILKLLKEAGATFVVSSSDNQRDSMMHRILRYFPHFPCSREYLQDYHQRFLKHLQLIDFAIENNVDGSLMRHGLTVLHDFIYHYSVNELELVPGGYARAFDKIVTANGFNINASSRDSDVSEKTLVEWAAFFNLPNAARYFIARGARNNTDKTFAKEKPVYDEAALNQFITSSKEVTLTELPLDKLSEGDRADVEMFRDDISGKLIEVPVMLDERLYNYDTLVALYYSDKVAPYIRKAFQLSDIEPQPEIANTIKKLAQQLKSKYQPDVKAPKRNGIFAEIIASLIVAPVASKEYEFKK